MATPDKRSPAPAATGNGANEHRQALTSQYIPTEARVAKLSKQGRVLRALYAGERLTRGESWPRYGDACLHSTVALLQRQYGVEIAREIIPIEGRFGTSRVARYWLNASALEDARRALAAELVKAHAYRTVGEVMEALGATEGAA